MLLLKSMLLLVLVILINIIKRLMDGKGVIIYKLIKRFVLAMGLLLDLKPILKLIGKTYGGLANYGRSYKLSREKFATNVGVAGSTKSIHQSAFV